MTQEQRALNRNGDTTSAPSKLKRAGIWSFGILLVLLVLLVLVASIYTNLSEKGWKTYTSRNSGLVSNDMSALAIDEAGRVWVGTVFGGLSVLAPDGSWRTYTSEGSGLVSGRIEALAFDEDGRVWVGTSGGLSVLAPDGSWTAYTSEDSGLVDNPVKALAIDAGDRVWVGTSGGLSVLAPDGSWTSYTSDDSGLANGDINALAFDEGGRVWVGTSRGGLSVLAPDGSWTAYTSEDSGFVGNYITALAIDGVGYVWVGTVGGGELSVLAPDGSWTTYTSRNSGLAVGHHIGALAFDEGGRVWVGISHGGLSVLAPDGSWRTYNSEDSGLASNSINALSIDGAGRVWVGTGNSLGLSRFGERAATSRSILHAVADVVSILRLATNLAAATFVILSIGWLIERRRRPTEAPSQDGWGFVLLWVLVSIVGFAVGIAVAGVAGVFMLISVLDVYSMDVAAYALLGALFGTGLGASLGVAQWLVLRRHVSEPGLWVLASAVGLAVGGAVGFVLDAEVLPLLFMDEILTNAVIATVYGASLGIAQWLVLRRQVSRSGWWVFVNTAGLAFVVVVGTSEEGVGAMGLAELGAGIVALVGYGVITGGVMVWLLRQPVSEEPSLPQDAA